MAVRIDQGNVNIRRAGEVYAFVLKVEFGLHQHAGFLLHGVAPGEYDLQPFAVDFAESAVSSQAESSFQALSNPSYSFGVKNQ
jgi:hypothetical protein